MGQFRGLHKCPVCGRVHYSMGIYCSRKCSERQRILNGSNRERMLKREAAKRGMTLEEYRVWRIFQAQLKEEREARRRAPQCRVWSSLCVQCGKRFTARWPQGKVCSAECRRRPTHS